MKSKKMLAQIAAFSLVFGMTGVVSSWADEIILDGTTVKFSNDAISLVKNEDGSFTVSNQKVKGVWLQNGSNLTANHVDFINGGDKQSEISVDNGSNLTVNGGSIDSDQDAFNVNDGSKAEVNNAKVTTGAWANNAAITLKNSTTSGHWLYAGNASPDPEIENDNGPVAEGLPVGSITIDGGTASVKNVLVQNKGQFNVTNGAVLDVTKDTSATDTEWTQPATGIKKGGEIVVTSWGPNSPWAEKENSETINKLDQVSTLAVNGATVKANKLTVEGKEAKELNYSESAAFTVKNNSTVVLDSAVLNRAKFYAENSQISIGDLHAENSQMSVKGDLNVSGRMEVTGGTFYADNLSVPDNWKNGNVLRFCDGAKAEIGKFVSTGIIFDINTYDYDISKGQGADVTIHQLALSNESEVQLKKGSLTSDTVSLDDRAQIFANNGTKAEIQTMTMDHKSRLDVGSYDDDDMVVKEAADVTVHQLDMKNNSTINIENGKLNSDQITMDKSTINIEGVGTLIANKMTLNNTSLSLSGIQNNMDTQALDADEDIQPLDVTQNGVTVEVKDTLDMNGGKLQVNDGSKLTTKQMKLTNGSTVTVDGTNSSFTIKGTDNTVSGGSKIELNGDSELNLKDLTLQDGGELYANWRSTVNADTISVEDGAKFQGVGRSTINVNNLRIGSNPGRIRVRGTFEGRVTDLNGNSLSKQQVKESFLLPTGDKTSLEFQDPEIDHTLVLHMNADGALTMQGKDFSQADTGNTRTYIMASWSANGDYNAEGHDIKNVNSLSANRLVINGTDITDSLGGAVDVSGKADSSLGNLTDEGKKVIRNTMKGDLDTKADAKTVTEELAKKASVETVNAELAKKADAEAMTEALSKKAEASELAQLKKGVNIDKAAWQSSLGDGQNAAGNTGLITGDTLHQALRGISTTGTVYKAGKHITIDKDNTIVVNTDGKVAAGDTGIVTGGQVQEAISKATEGIATNANVANKADKNLSNLSDAGKTVIKKTMMEGLAGKADTNLTNLSDAGKEAIKNTVKADLMGKADTSYVDEKVKDKVNTSDFTAIKDKVDAHETALAGKADKSYVDAAVKKATEGVATDANVASKADKDLSNLSEKGKNVIKETMKEDLAAKADKTYVDDQLKNKVDTADFNTVKEQVDSHEKALASKADKKDLSNLSAKVDGKADKTYVDGVLDKKANAADVYTKADTDKKIADSLTDVNKAVDGKADKTDVEGLSQKVDKNVSELKASKADANASNIDAAAYTAKLNTGKVEDGNKGLVSGGAVWNAIKDVKNSTGAGWVKVNGDTVAIASDAGATKVSVAGKNGDRVLTGVKTDEKDASSAANVGYVNSTAISLTDSMNAMNSKLSDDIKNAGAVGAALAGLHHLDYDPDNKLDVAVAAGNYRGKSATAMGLFYQPNEMMMVSAGATIGADDNAYNVGLSFKVGKGQTGLTTSKAAMSQEIKELKAAKKESDQKMAAQDEEIRALKEQVAMLVKEMKLSNTVEKDMKK